MEPGVGAPSRELLTTSPAGGEGDDEPRELVAATLAYVWRMCETDDPQDRRGDLAAWHTFAGWVVLKLRESGLLPPVSSGGGGDGNGLGAFVRSLPPTRTWCGSSRCERMPGAPAEEGIPPVGEGRGSYVPLSIREAGGEALEAWKAGASYDDCAALVREGRDAPAREPAKAPTWRDDSSGGTDGRHWRVIDARGWQERVADEALACDLKARCDQVWPDEGPHVVQRWSGGQRVDVPACEDGGEAS